MEALSPAPGEVIVDATVGLGGHAEELLKRITPGGKLIGIDKDAEALEIADKRLKHFADACVLVRGDFKDLKAIFEKEGLGKADGFLFDLGVSSLQFDKPERGFSIRYDAPLDMRMDKEGEVTAAYLVNKLNEAELDLILKNYGEERFHRRVAREIVRRRKEKPIETTAQLVDAVLRALPYKRRHGIHPATRTFQALRIAVNAELEALAGALDEAVDLLKPGGRICVISYHSLEDRIVKRKFLDAAKEGVLELVAKKPLTPDEEEVADNPRARSAKLRVARKI